MVRYYGIFSGVMGGYHFIRGCRVSHRPSKPFNGMTEAEILIADRLLYGVANGFLYSLPIWNINGMYRLMNRIEIHCRGLKKKDHPYVYEEVGGYNLHTF